MKKIVLFLAVIGSLLSVTALPQVAYAGEPTPRSTADQVQCDAGSNENCVGNITDPAAEGDCANTDCNIVNKYLNPFIAVLSIFVGIAVVLGIVIGGIQYTTAAGDPQKVAGAKKHIRNAIVALIGFFFLNAFLRFLVPGAGLL